jgi:hypothetical protein
LRAHPGVIQANGAIQGFCAHALVISKGRGGRAPRNHARSAPRG